LLKDKNNSAAVRKHLLLEIVLVTAATILTIKLLYSSSNDRETSSVTPFLLIAAAVIPTALGKRSFAEIGFRTEPFGLILSVLFKTCLVIFPVLCGGVCLLTYYGLSLPLRPIVPEGRLFSWLIYQFIGVAVAEEIFFRGYLQSNMLRLLALTLQKKGVFCIWMSVIVSAAVFAVSHCVLLGNLTAMITFFPGLIFGWLFVKSRSLLAPILFHGLANVVYGFIAIVLS
jgi:membrane protease YdiL (CAAX protease family)